MFNLHLQLPYSSTSKSRHIIGVRAALVAERPEYSTILLDYIWMNWVWPRPLCHDPKLAQSSSWIPAKFRTFGRGNLCLEVRGALTTSDCPQNRPSGSGDGRQGSRNPDPDLRFIDAISQSKALKGWRVTPRCHPISLPQQDTKTDHGPPIPMVVVKCSSMIHLSFWWWCSIANCYNTICSSFFSWNLVIYNIYIYIIYWNCDFSGVNYQMVHPHFTHKTPI